MASTSASNPELTQSDHYDQIDQYGRAKGDPRSSRPKKEYRTIKGTRHGNKWIDTDLPRTGETVLQPGKTPRYFVMGETAIVVGQTHGCSEIRGRIVGLRRYSHRVSYPWYII